MMDLFTPAANDQSLYYLSQVFGSVGGILPMGGSTTLLSQMFKTFNSIILVIAVLMLAYITIVGILGTAHEGEFMGKKMNNIWIPIRAVLGIALLVPTGAGWSMIQIIMMWVIVQGVGAADSVWKTALDYINKAGSPYVQITMPAMSAMGTFGDLFKGLACYNTVYKGTALPDFDDKASSWSLKNCGTLKYCNATDAAQGDTQASCTDSSSVKCAACQVQVDALKAIIPLLDKISKSLVAADEAYRDFYDNSWNTENNKSWQWIYNYCSSKGISQDKCCKKGLGSPSATCKADPKSTDLPAINGPQETSASADAVKNLYWPFYPGLEGTVGQGVNFMKVVVGQYQDMANGVLSKISQADDKNKTLINDVVNQNKDNGWIFAGALYYQLANLNSSNLRDSLPDMSFSAGANLPSDRRTNIEAADYLLQVANGDTSLGSTQAGGTGSNVNQFSSTMGDAFKSNIGINDPGSSVKVQNQGDVNPLLMLQIFGMIMLILVQVIFLIVLALVFAIGLGSSISVYVLGTGVSNPLESWSIMITVFLVPLFWATMAILVSVGALLAVYTPLLPYIYFTFGALAWIIATIEALVAGPLVALGIISPTGQHEIMGKAEPALLLLFNLFLRPTLMIFGLMAAMLLAVVACKFVNATFAVVMRGWVAYDPLSLVFILVAYVSIILAVLNKCFSVINIIPQQVIRWIGGQPEAIETPTEEIRGRVEGAGGRIGAGAEGTGGRIGEHRQAKRQADKETAQDAERANIAGTSSTSSSEGGGKPKGKT